MVKTYEAWSRKQVVGALCMDVEAVFPGMAKECLAGKMRNMKIHECLVRWMLNFISDRSVKMVVDGQEGTELAGTWDSHKDLQYHRYSS
jgi:hypothetical protein